jgi:hypothetical protein
VRSLPGVFWQLNDNFVVLAIKGVLNMLHSSGCQELSELRQLAASSDASIVEDVSAEVQKIADHLVCRWWKNHGLPEALHRLEEDNADAVSFVNIW